ncbi:response regulator transcription factor [Nocardioides astragali]|uniref:Response regulator n=1 Tax=Nocardioides astragali TaxID=1776736 RepID=A0ABW2N024_9ACTN|nr:response regulator transcription factor [Nocardioides astragali]
MDESPGTGALRVVVVDDHTFYRDGLVGLLEESGLVVVADVATGEAVLGAVAETQPDAVVMDLSMPGMGGVEATRLLSEHHPSTPVVMLTVSQEEDDVLAGLLAGARGFVLKDGPVEDVVKAIREAAAGRAFLSARVSRRLLEHVQRTHRRHGGSRFTEQEIDVLSRLSEGESPETIATSMGTTERAVRRLASDVVTKMQVENRGEIAVRALRDRIV